MSTPALFPNVCFRIALIIPLCLISGFAFAQPGARTTVSGQVVANAGKPGAFITILLLHASDSTLVTGTFTETAGRYKFPGVASGSYRVGINSLGYQKTVSAPFTVTAAEPDFAAPLLTALEDTRLLQEVQVTGQKPLIEILPDKTVFNVDNSLVAAGGTALEVLALSIRIMQKGMIVHSDRSGQCVGKVFRRLLDEHQIRQSMSRAGNAYDNAFMESCFSRFKAELLEDGAFENKEDAQTEIFEYIEMYHKTKRRHSVLGYQSPMNYEKNS